MNAAYETERQRQQERLGGREHTVMTVGVRADEIDRYIELIGGEFGERLVQYKATQPDVQYVSIEIRTLEERVAYSAAYKTLERESDPRGRR